jgi:F0F1-type ATP synthase membrane subunit b/b'
MGKDGDKDSFVELGGFEFKKVKIGLDETQVASCINELISQRDKFRQHEEHLSSLTKLAEKTVAEADKLAEEIKTEAKDQAEAEASAFIAEAKEQAQKISEEERTKIINMATEQAEAIKSEAKQEAELLLKDQRNKIQLELNNSAHQLYSHLLSELENLKQQVVELEEGFEHKLPYPAEETITGSIAQDEKQVVELEEGFKHTLPYPAEEIGTGSIAQDEKNDEDEFMKLIQLGDREGTSEPDWELEILPPIDITKIMGVVNQLDSLPGVESTEIIPETDSPSIQVFLREPMNLIDIMRTLSEVDQVKEDMTDTAGANTKPRKVQLVLKEGIVQGETKERLNSEISNILADPSPPPSS